MNRSSTLSLFHGLLLLAMLLQTRSSSAQKYSTKTQTRSHFDYVTISPDHKGFQFASSGKTFVPLGFNYDRDYKMRLIEDYWDAEWPTVQADFKEMAALGAQVARIHLQFARFMPQPNQPNQKELKRLAKLLQLAEKTHLHLDLTGLACYHKHDVPKWFDALTETDRWAAQAEFWQAVAKTCAHSPAVFCYDLINEPVVPGGPLKEWYMDELAGFSYVQAITLNPGQRDRDEIAQAWVQQMSAAIRREDSRHLITLGMLPTVGSGFAPRKLASDLDFISVHIYPEGSKVKDSLQLLKEFSVGKPVVVEETMVMKCGADELRQFILDSRTEASGWIGFYWGQTTEELEGSSSVPDAMMREWLKVFREIRSVIF